MVDFFCLTWYIYFVVIIIIIIIKSERHDNVIV